MSQDPYFSGRGDDFASLVSVERIDRQIIFYGRFALLRYLDLIEKMSALPGKKMILLYRSGLLIEFAHAELMDEIAAAALRRRVSFFAVDSAGLRASTPVELEDSQVTFDWDSRRRRSEPDLTSRQLAEVEPQQGLVSLAKTTGGKALINSNDMGSILKTVLDESSNYYVLGYHPRDLRSTGRFRRVEVSVKRPDVKLRAPRGYFEAKPFEQQSKRQKSVALYRALLSGAPSDFRLETSLSFFAAPEGRTATIFSTGARPREPNPKRSETSEKPSELWSALLCPLLLVPAAREHSDPRNAIWMEHKRKGLALAQERAPAAQVVWMEDTIHDVPLQRPEELARVIADFLQGLA